MWQPISTAPFDRDIELAVMDKDEPHALVFPCRRVPGGWIHAGTKKWLGVNPTPLAGMDRKALNRLSLL
jgi:hypothetical protein